MYRTTTFTVVDGMFDVRLAHGEATFHINGFGRVLSMTEPANCARAPVGLFSKVTEAVQQLRYEFQIQFGRRVQFGRRTPAKRQLLEFYAQSLNDIIPIAF